MLNPMVKPVVKTFQNHHNVYGQGQKNINPDLCPSQTMTPDLMHKEPVYQILAQDIKDLGVDTVFGLMSDDICQLFATLDAMGVRMIGARHETNAVMMAMGYAAATDVNRYWRDGMLMSIGEGTSDIQRDIISKGLLNAR